jgi:hypothetical protein
VPVLVGIARLFSVRRILEFGCGQYSTLTFLNRLVFRDLVALDSYENDPIWLGRIGAVACGDSRLHLQSVNGPMHLTAAGIEFEKYDLVFIDDSILIPDRSATIRQVSRRYCVSNLVLIHDYEMRAYREAARSFEDSFTFTALNPNTGVLWEGMKVHSHHLKKINSLIQEYSTIIRPENVNRWIEAFDHNG